jgi:hypothetical protein
VLLRKGLIYRHFLEKHQPQDLQDVAWISGDGLFFGEDRDQHLHAHSDPYLGLDRVQRRAEERLDPQVLLGEERGTFYFNWERQIAHAR